MKKIFLRSISLLLVVLMLYTSVPVSAFASVDLTETTTQVEPVEVEEETTEETTTPEETPEELPEFSYTENEDGTIVITAYNKQERFVTVPATIDEKTVVAIGENAFANNTYILEVTIPEGITEIGEGAFIGCPQLRNVIVPQSVTTIAAAAFEATPNLTILCYEKSPANTFARQNEFDFSFITSAEENIITETINDTVTWRLNMVTGLLYISGEGAIPDYSSNTMPWYSYISNMTGLVIEEGITDIGANAFRDCTKFKGDLIIPNTVLTIGDGSFFNCSGLTHLRLSEELTVIEDEAFSGCSDLCGDLIIPDKVTQVNGNAFLGVTKLTSIRVGKSITMLGSNDLKAFDYDLSNLQKIEFTGTQVPYIVSGSSDYDFSSLKAVYIPYLTCESYASNYFGAFGNARFYTIDSEDEFVIIDGKLVMYNGNSSSVIIPEGIIGIGGGAFYNCLNIENITIPDSVASIGMGAFYNCKGLKSVNIPTIITKLEKSTFYGCKSLENIIIPNSVTIISDWVFSACTGLINVTIPNNVTSIDYYAFYGCANLESITIYSPNCTIYNSSNTIASNATIYGYLSSTAETYAKNYNRNFEEIVHDHEWETINSVEATCTKNGSVSYRCNVCQHTYTEKTNDALGHAFTEWKVKTAATCTEDGIETRSCERCGANYDTLENVLMDSSLYPESEHSYGNDMDKTYEFSCEGAISLYVTFSGSTEFESSCDFLYIYDADGSQIGKYSGTSLASKTIKINGDNFKLRLTTDSSVTRYGFAIQKIEAEYPVDDFVKTNPALGHDFSEEWTTDVEATCETVGSKSHHCSRCDEKRDVTEIPALGHKYTSVVTDSTCVTDGFTTNTCSVCDNVVVDSIVPASGHKLPDGTVATKEPTCTEDGSREGVCTVCNEAITETIPKLGHTLSSEWTVQQELTCTDNGIKVKYCSVCGLVGFEKRDGSDAPKCVGSSYVNNMSKTFETYSVEGASKLVIHFKSGSELEGSYDKLYVYAGTAVNSSNLVGTYTGNISSTVVTVNSSSFTMKMTTDGSVIENGFEIDYIECYLEDAYQITEALGHDYGDWITIEPTCTANGSKERICSRCNDVNTQSISALGHNYEFDRTEPYTCTTAGAEVYKCTRCAGEYSEEFAARHLDSDEDGFCDFCNDPFGGVLDLVFIIDTTGSMSGEISVVKSSILSYADTLSNSNIPHYISLIEYSNNCENGYYNVIFDLTDDDEVIQNEIEKFSMRNGAYEPVYTAIIDGLNELHWGTNSAKRIILIGDEESNGDLSKNTYAAAVEMLNNNNIPVYSVATGGSNLSSFKNLAQATGGSYYQSTSSQDFSDVLTDIIETIPESIHIHTYDETNRNEYCAQEGSVTYTCSGCGIVLTTTVDPIGHDFSEEWTIDVEATCETAGSKSHHCSRCDSKSDVTAISATGHSYTSVTTDPTCTEKGYTTYTCSICSSGYTGDYVDALGHSYGEWIERTAPTCTKTGVDYHICAVCELEETRTSDALGHDYSEEWTVDKKETCTKDGSKSHHCSRCDSKSDVTAIPATGHSYTSATTDPTCTEKGYTTYTCSVCSSCYTGDYVDALGHTYGEWIKRTEPTCTKTGLDYQICSKCNSEATRTIEALGHDYSEEWSIDKEVTCTANGSKSHHCSRCDSKADITVISAEGHTYGEWVKRTEPTCTKTGLDYQICSKCNSEATRKVDELGHDYHSEYFEASEGQEAYTLYTCSRCDDKYTVLDPAVKLDGVEGYSDIRKVTIAWLEAVEASVTGYRIYRKTETETEFTLYAAINGRGSLTYTDEAVEIGKYYTYKVAAMKGDIEGVPSDEVTVCPVIDTEPPTVTKFTPVNNSYIWGTKTITITAVDNVRPTAAKLFYSIDDGQNWILIGEDEAAPFNFSLDTTTLSDGVITMQAFAYDAEGNESQPMTCKYSVDNTGPEKVTGLEATSVLTTKITLEWNDVTADDAACYVLQSKTIGDYATVSRSITSLGYNVTNLIPGTAYTFRVAAMDVHGNIGEYSDEIIVTTEEDNIAPVVTDLSPAPGRYNSYVPFRASAGDDFAIKTIEIQVSTDRETWKTVSTKEYTSYNKTVSYSYNVPLDDYEDISIYVRAIATDFAGNASPTDETAAYVEYIVDKTAPNNPLGLSAVGGEGWICISWTQGDEADLGTYSLYRSTEADGVYSCIASNLRSVNYYDESAKRYTDYYYKLRVQDTVGNLSDFSEVVSARVNDDTIAPQVVSVYPASGSIVGPQYKTVSTFIQDNYGLEKITIKYRVNDATEYTILKENKKINAISQSVSVDLPVNELNDGDKIYIHVEAIDIVGLVSEFDTEYVYSVDKVAPTISNLSVSLENDKGIVTWSDADCETDIEGYKVYRISETGTEKLITTRSFSSTRNYTSIDGNLLNVGKGNYMYKVEAYDKVGNCNVYVTDAIFYEPVVVVVNTAPNVVIDGFEVMEIGVEKIFDAGKSTDDGTIVSYNWDFGDGTTSDKVQVVKKYTEVGTYTVTLTLTDDEGLTATKEMEVTVSERTVVGTIKVKVVDENNKAIYGAPVYFDLGGENQKVVDTDSSGSASLLMEKGEHVVGVYHSGYLPVQKNITVIPNATRNITMTIIEQELVTGEFEVKRMTFDEIKAAGIDAYAPENQQVFEVTVQIKYGSQVIPATYTRNDTQILTFNIGDWSDNTSGGNGGSGGSSGSSGRKIDNLIFIPNEQNKEIIAVLDVPATASYLKEFFDVKLHIINNASSEFEIVDNDIYLDVPTGMTMMTGLTGDWYESPDVHVDSIKGQQTETLAWVLRGDKEGEYHLNADFNGTLATFNEEVHAQFKTKEPIKVYGLSNIKMNVEVNDEIKYNAFYFNIGLENTGDIDIYNPQLDFGGIVKNITASTIKAVEGIDKTQGEADFDVLSTLLNVRIDHSDGTTQYIPFDWNDNGTIETSLDTLTPGSAVYYEFVAYNAIDYDGITYFRDSAEEILSEYGGEVEVKTVEMKMYSMNDATDKLNAIKNNVDNSDIANDTSGFDVDEYTHQIEFVSAVTNKVQKLTFLYDDAFFKKTATEGVNNGLAMASMYLSTMAYVKNEDYSKMRSLLGNDGLKYENIQSYNYDRTATETDNDFVGYTFATKEIEVNGKKENVVLVIVRGTNQYEWLSNFNIGRDGTYHQGFFVAASDLILSLNTYLADKNLEKDNTKFWITGHSRGAAVANIVAEKLTTDEKLASKDNIYAYTFATPATHTNADTSLTNIINFCNEDDLIVYVPLEEWGFKKAGQTVDFSMTGNSRMAFSYFTGAEYAGNAETMKAIVNCCEEIAPTVNDYYDNNVDVLMNMLAKFLAGSSGETETSDSFTSLLVNSAFTVALPLINLLISVVNVIKTEVFHAHCPEGYISYLESLYSYESVVATIKADKGYTKDVLEITRDNAFAYVMDDGNYLYFTNSDVANRYWERFGESIYNALKLIATIDFNTLTKEEQKNVTRKILLDLITDDLNSDKIKDTVDTHYIDAIQEVLGAMEGLFKDSSLSTSDSNLALKSLNSHMSNINTVYSLANTLKLEGDKGLQRDLIALFVGSGLTVQGMDILKDKLYYEISYGSETTTLSQAMSDFGKYASNYIDYVFVKPIEVYNDYVYAQFVHSTLKSLAAEKEARLILDTIIATYTDEDIAKDLYNSMFAYVMGPAWALLDLMDVDIKAIVVSVAKEMRSDMEKNFNEDWEFASELLHEYGSSLTKDFIKFTLSDASIWYKLFKTTFELVDTATGLGKSLENASTFNIATFITVAVKVAFGNLWDAYKSPDKIDEINDIYGTKYTSGDLDEIAFDCMSMLKATCNTRLLGEYTFKTIVNDNNGTLFKGDAKYDASIVSKCNEKFGTSYNNIEDVYDYIYRNVLRARDAIFNVEFTSDIVKPVAPSVSFNYDTCTTNEAFDSSYEYCLSDGEWKACDGNEIAVPLKTTTQVLRVRKASANETVAGEITSITIFAEKEISKILKAKYDNGTYYFTNLLDIYTYEFCLLDNQYAIPDWSNSTEVKGGTNASIKGDYGKYIAIRTLGNPERYETISKYAILSVATKEELKITVWGNGTVSQSDESGVYFIGDDVTLTASANEGAAFDGWYIAGECVGEYDEYILEMYSGAEIVAKFVGGDEVSAESVTISGLSQSVYALTSAKAVAEINPSNTTDKTVTWTTSDSNVASIDTEGSINFLKEGNVTITATLSNGISSSVDVNVLKNEVVEIRIYAPATKLTYHANEELDLTGLVVVAEYTSGAIKEIKDYVVSGYEKSCGDKTIVITYSEKTTSFEVTVNHVIFKGETVEPTCTEKGYTTYDCHFCDYTYNDDFVDELGHKEVIIEAIESTCTEIGYTSGLTCSVCNKVLIAPEEVEVLGHSFGEWYYTTEPTCTEDGEQKRECSRCEHFETNVASATNHPNAKNAEKQDATCSEIGYTAGKYCDDCKTWIEGHEEIEALGHNLGEWYYTTEPTCTKEGEEKRECILCDIFETRKVDKKAHNFKSEFTVDEAATCTTDGIKSRHCKDCDTKTDVTVIKATGHKYESSVIKDSTCLEDGLVQYICECGSGYTEIIPATGHIDNNEDGICDNCNEDLGTDSGECDCNCHKTGFMGFIWKIINFFQKLFKTNLVCACGDSHY